MSTPSSLRVLTAVVEDHPGVLTRVAGMVRRRGFNIQGLSVGPTDERGRSRMTLTVDAGHAEVDQVQKQLERLVEVIEVEDLTEATRLSRELALVKLAVTGPERDRTLAEVDRFGGRVVDIGAEHVIVEVSDEPDRLRRCIDLLGSHKIAALARSGPLAMVTT